MSNKATALRQSTNVLGYMGVNPITPVPLYFDQRAPTTRDFNENMLGSLWVVNTEGQNPNYEIWVLMSVAGNSATWIQIFPATGSEIQFVTDAGTAVPAAGILNVLGGPNINTAGAANNLYVNLNTSLLQPNTNTSGSQGLYSLGGISFMHNYGTENTFLGGDAGNLTLTGMNNTAIGHNAGNALTSGNRNSFFGDEAGARETSGNENVYIGTDCGETSNGASANVGVGYTALQLLTDGIDNTAVGASALGSLDNGLNNVAVGNHAGANYASDESGNIVIGSNNFGTLGENFTIRIGVEGTQTTTFMAGINGNTVANEQVVTINSVTGQLGTMAGSPVPSYSTGTWTPHIQFGGVEGAAGGTYTTQIGRYTQIGNAVYYQVEINFPALSGATGTLTVTGLPFNAGPSYSYNGIWTCFFGFNWAYSGTGQSYAITLSAEVLAGANVINLYQTFPGSSGAGLGQNAIPLDQSIISIATSGPYQYCQFTITGMYFTA